MKFSGARYTKNSFVAIPEDSKDGFKGSESRLLDALNGRYSHRYRGYVLPNSKREITEALANAKWDAKARILDSSPSIFEAPDGKTYSLKEAKKVLLEALKKI